MARLLSLLFLCALASAATAQPVRVSVSSAGAQVTDGDLFSRASISADGRRLVFATNASGLVPGDTNGANDVFLRDLATGTTTRLSVGVGGVQADGQWSFAPSISADGRFVAFGSDATNLGSGPPCAGGTLQFCTSVYRTDLSTGIHLHVSRAPNGDPPNGDSHNAVLSADGRYVAFESAASNLVPGDTNGQRDVFVHDTLTGITTRVSVATGGAQATFESPTSPFELRPAISADGRFVAFASGATNLAPGDTNRACVVDLIGLVNCPDVFVHDRATGVTTRVSVATGGAQGDHGSAWPAISADGRYVAFLSSAGNLGAGAPPAGGFHSPGRRAVAYVHDRVTGITRAAWPQDPLSPSDLRDTSISGDGRIVAFTASNRVDVGGSRPRQVFVWEVPTGVVRMVSTDGAGQARPEGAGDAALSPGGRSLVVATRAALVPDDTNGRDDLYEVDPLDADRDTLETTWETNLGLDPHDSTGSNGASGDPDADGVPNGAEFTRQTHPRGLASATRYFAEGATNAFFETRLSLVNPGTTAARVQLRFDRADGVTRSTQVIVPARQSRKLALSGVEGLTTAEFSTVVESDQPIVAERLMWWSADQAYGTHADRAIASPALAWFFAEGATGGGFDLFYLLQNPNDAAAEVRVRYLRAAGTPLEKTYTLAPRSRTNIWVDLEDFSGQPLLAQAEVSAAIEVLNGQPIIAERAMYLTSPAAAQGRAFGAGHEAAGVTAAATEWFLAEGATGAFFDLFVLIANPGVAAADVEVQYLLPDGRTVSRTYAVAAASRQTIWVDQEGAALADTAVSMRVRSRNGVPIVVERAMWWPGPTPATWAEAHAGVGTTTSASRWAVADGIVTDAPAATDTYVLVANLAPAATTVRVTLLFDDGTPEVWREFTVLGQSRFNVDVRSEFAPARGKGFGVLVESLDGASLVVERSTYNDAGGAFWAGGANTLATPQP